MVQYMTPKGNSGMGGGLMPFISFEKIYPIELDVVMNTDESGKTLSILTPCKCEQVLKCDHGKYSCKEVTCDYHKKKIKHL